MPFTTPAAGMSTTQIVVVTDIKQVIDNSLARNAFSGLSSPPIWGKIPPLS